MMVLSGDSLAARVDAAPDRWVTAGTLPAGLRQVTGNPKPANKKE